MAMNPEKLETLEEALRRAGKRLATQVKGVWSVPFDESGMDAAECANFVTQALDSGFDENLGVRLGEVYDLAAGSYFTIRKTGENTYRPMLAASVDDPMLIAIIPSAARVLYTALSKKGVKKDEIAAFLATSIDIALEELSAMMAAESAKTRRRARKKVVIEDPEEMPAPTVPSALTREAELTNPPDDADTSDANESEG